jgi:hypothetical protein
MSTTPPQPQRKRVPTYPQAQRMADYHRGNINLLTAQREAINTAINQAYNRIGSAELESSDLSGAYYDEFITRTGYWMEDFNRICRQYESFLMELDELIISAEAMESLWRSRIHITHEIIIGGIPNAFRL